MEVGRGETRLRSGAGGSGQLKQAENLADVAWLIFCR